MKRILTILFVVMFAGQALAQTTFEIGNLKYTVTDETNHYVSVGKGSTYPTGELEIPSQVTCPETNGTTYTITSIGSFAFGECSSLTSVTIPESVISISGEAFLYCTSLTEIKVSSDNAKYTSENGVLFNKDKTTLVYYPSNNANTYNIPEGVTYIGECAFHNCRNLASITIPKGVTSIGDFAFLHCGGLTSIIIPDGVTNIGSNAFQSCNGLTSIRIPNSVTFIDQMAFGDCSNLTSVTIPSSITRIDHGTFSGCSSLTSVIIPNSVISIGSYAFEYCSGLTSVTIPNSVTSIGSYAFINCSNATFYCECEETSKPSGWNASWNAQAKWGCKVIRAVANNAKHGSVVVDGENYAVKGDDGSLWYLAGTTNGKATLTATAKEGYNFIKWEDNAETGSSRTIDVTKSETYTAEFSLKPATFVIDGLKYTTNTDNDNVTVSANSTDLSGNIEIPDKVTYDDVEYTITSIGNNAFEGCSGLTSVTIGNSVISIGCAAFYGCIGLTSVTIPGSVTFIDMVAFACGSGLTSICYEGSSQPRYYAYNSFSNVDKTIPVCVPADYSSDSWCEFSNLIKGHNKVTDNAVAATCTTTGLTEGSHCSYCGKVFVEQEEVSALGHTADSVEFENTIAATCTTVGSYDSVVYCSVCQAELFREEKEIPVIDHTYSTIVTAPTCTAVGYTTHTCSVCEYTYNSDTVDSKGHKADSVEFENIKQPTCTAAGSKDSVVFCSVCEVELSREEKEIPALGHTYSNYVTAPACTAVGFTTHTCSVCEYTYNSDTVAANGHTEVIDAAVAATCTAAGKTEGKHCSVCNETIVAQTEIPALGHEFKDYVYNNDATTTADGTETATCTRGCGATDTRTATGTKLAETPEKGTAVAESAANAVTIYAYGNTIIVENATNEISVYNAMGTLICRDARHCVRTEINVNAPGVYIVKTGGVVKRVMVN